MNSNRPLRIVILDFVPETNRGDAALQVGMINLINKYFDRSKISVVCAIGANQTEKLIGEYDHSSKMPVVLTGGLKPTFFPLGKTSRSILLVELLNVLGFITSLFPLVLSALKMPPSLIKAILPGEFRKSFSMIYDADLVIWNRRNFRSRKFRLLEIYRILYTIYHPMLTILLDKPMAHVGTSLWKLKSPLAKRALKVVLKHCFFISCREESSHSEAIKLLPDVDKERLRLLPDLSFVVFDKLDEIIKHRRTFSKADLPVEIGITLVDWASDGQDGRTIYKNAITESIKYFVRNGSQVTIVPQVTKKWENFMRILDEIYSDLSPDETKNVNLVEGEPTVNKLLEIYSQLDFLIATRLHSSIFALAVQTPVVAVAYDAGGKWGILDGMGYKDYIIPYSEITASGLIDKVSTVWKNKDEILEVVHKRVAKNTREVDLNVSLIAKYFDTDFRDRD